MSDLLLAALFAALVAVAATRLIERFGGRIGGVIGSSPTTIVPAALGMFHDLDTPAFQAAMAAVPLGMLVNTGFLWTWRVLPPRWPTARVSSLLTLQLAASLSVWAALAASSLWVTAALTRHGATPLVVGGAAWLIHLVVGVTATWRGVPAAVPALPVGPGALATRGLLAAAAIATALVVARSGAPLAAGMASVFPAIFVTTLVSLWIAQGSAVPLGAVGPMMLGSLSVGAFALAAAGLFPRLGPGWGALAAWVSAVGMVTTPAVAWIRSRPATASPG